jgi:hypothetical protein
VKDWIHPIYMWRKTSLGKNPKLPNKAWIGPPSQSIPPN